MKRMMWLAGACLLGGLMVVGVVSGLRGPARAADVMAPQAPATDPGDVVINEVAWMGTAANSSDEWIELYNNTDSSIDIGNWSIYGADTGVCLNFSAADGSITTTIPAHGYLIYANHDDDVRDSGGANMVDIWDATIGMNDASPGQIILYDAPDCGGSVIDTANQATGNWFAGDSGDRKTMERKDPTGSGTDGSNWATNDPSIAQNGLDAGDNSINGTPKARNSCYSVPGLSLAKEGPAVATAGLTLAYRLLVSNTGDLTATGIVVTDVLPTGLTFVSQDSLLPFSQPASDTLRWEPGDLPSNTLHLITLTLHADQTLSGTVTNVVTATEQAGRTERASWPVTVLPHVRLYALAPANYEGSGEAAALINLSPYTASLGSWWLNDDPEVGGVSFPATATIRSGQILWLAQDADDFYPVWGFDADWTAQTITRPVSKLNGDWPGFTDTGEDAYLLDAAGHVVDALAYGTGSASQGWSGPAVPYRYAGYGAGQVLYRKLDQATGLPVPDTNTAADWAQDPDDPINGRKLRYPGWDLEALFFPAEISTTANFTLAVAPEGALDLVSQTIASAQHTLRIEAYTLKSVALYEVISDRIQAGVVVTVLLESSPAGGMDDVEKWIVQRLHDPPTSTIYFIGKTAPRYSYQHAKFILIDDRLALVSSDNFGESSMPPDPKGNGTMGHRGFAAVTDSPGVVARLADIFRRDCDPLHHLDVAPYDGTFAPPAPLPSPDWTTYTAPFTAPLVTTADHVTVLHAPEHALRDQDSLLGLLGRAASGDRIAVMQMNEPFTWTAGVGSAGLNPRLQAAITASQNGAKVRILLDAYYDDPLAANKNTAACLTLNGIAAQEGLNLTCRLANVTGLGIHAKVFLASVGDERWVHLGSINGTENSNKRNRELALQFRSAEAYEWMLTVFDYDWNLGHGPMVHRIYLPLVMRDHVSPADYPLITEVFINPPGETEADDEWIELYNPGPEVSIAGWMLGDAINLGDYRDGRYAFPAEAQFSHGQVIVVAACATNFSAAYGFNPDYEWTNCSDIPDLVAAGSWDGFGLALGNTGDEVLLLNSSGTLVDSTAWGGASRAGVIPFTDFTAPFPSDASLKRYPPDTDRDDCSRDFYVSYSPSPGVVAGN